MKTDWTKHDLDLLAEQLNRYYFQIQRLKDVKNVPNLPTVCCSICKAVKRNCNECLLNVKGLSDNFPCFEHKTYIFMPKRSAATIKQLQDRLDYLIECYETAGLTVEDAYDS